MWFSKCICSSYYMVCPYLLYNRSVHYSRTSPLKHEFKINQKFIVKFQVLLRIVLCCVLYGACSYLMDSCWTVYGKVHLGISRPFVMWNVKFVITRVFLPIHTRIYFGLSLFCMLESYTQQFRCPSQCVTHQHLQCHGCLALYANFLSKSTFESVFPFVLISPSLSTQDISWHLWQKIFLHWTSANISVTNIPYKEGV